jgi:hypothetical protein
MTWSAHRIGSKAKVAALVAEDLDKAAANYPGKAEADDILSVKAHIMVAIDAISDAPDAYSPTGYGVDVTCSGSHSSWCSSGQWKVERVTLAV